MVKGFIVYRLALAIFGQEFVLDQGLTIEDCRAESVYLLPYADSVDAILYCEPSGIDL